jgi:TPR repeat protein
MAISPSGSLTSVLISFFIEPLMKTKTGCFLFFSTFLLVCVFQLTGCQSPQKNAPIEGVVPIERTAPIIQESWEIISNQWGSVPLGKIQQTAEKGDVSAQYYLAIAYDGEIGVTKNLDEEFKWMNLAAQQGMARAQRRLGSMFEDGQGVETNMSEAIVWYQKAAQQGDAWAQVDLGWHYESGIGIETNYFEALEWYKKAAQQGNSQAQMDLGKMYEDGVGVPTNYVEAAEFYRLAAEQGHSMAQNNLGWFYANGLGVPQDFGEALKWMQKSADQGNSYAQKNLPWLSGKAFEAQYQMAKKYQKGDGVPKDAVEAFKWMQKAAQQNPMISTKVSDAQYEVGLMFEKGEGVETNLLEARNYIILASQGLGSLEGGQPDACFRVGQWYENGDDVPHDDYRAIKYYWNAVRALNGRKYKSQAAEDLLKLYAEGRGLSKTNQEPEDYIDRELVDKKAVIEQFQGEITTSQAEFYVGRINYQGTLVSQDLVEAAARFQVAADEGLDDARKISVELEPKMSTAQKEAAKARSSNLKKNLNENRSMEQALIKVYGW